MAKKTWKQKLHVDKKPELEVLDKPYAGADVGDKLLIPTPIMVDQYVRNIPNGVHTSMQQMRADLAAEYGAAITCPLCSGIFLRIVAEAAYDELQEGKSIDDIAPFWRMIDNKAPILKKLSFGTDFVIEQRKKEGLPV